MKNRLLKLAVATGGTGMALGLLAAESYAYARYSDQRLKRGVRAAGGLSRLRAL